MAQIARYARVGSLAFGSVGEDLASRHARTVALSRSLPRSGNLLTVLANRKSGSVSAAEALRSLCGMSICPSLVTHIDHCVAELPQTLSLSDTSELSLAFQNLLNPSRVKLDTSDYLRLIEVIKCSLGDSIGSEHYSRMLVNGVYCHSLANVKSVYESGINSGVVPETDMFAAVLKRIDQAGYGSESEQLFNYISLEMERYGVIWDDSLSKIYSKVSTHLGKYYDNLRLMPYPGDGEIPEEASAPMLEEFGSLLGRLQDKTLSSSKFQKQALSLLSVADSATTSECLDYIFELVEERKDSALGRTGLLIMKQRGLSSLHLQRSYFIRLVNVSLMSGVDAAMAELRKSPVVFESSFAKVLHHAYDEDKPQLVKEITNRVLDHGFHPEYSCGRVCRAVLKHTDLPSTWMGTVAKFLDAGWPLETIVDQQIICSKFQAAFVHGNMYSVQELAHLSKLATLIRKSKTLTIDNMLHLAITEALGRSK